MRPPVRLLPALLAAPLCPAMGQGAAGPPSIEVAGTSFRVTLPAGRVLGPPALIGAVLDVADEAGRNLTVRIDAVAPDPSDRDGDVWLHHFSVRDIASGGWRDLCTTPGPDGTIGGFRWREAG